MRFVDNLLNRFTMYQVVFYLLGFLFILSFFLSVLRFLPYNPLLLVQNSVVIFISAYVFNLTFSKLLKAYSNIQSTIITTLILILISPVQLSLPFWTFILIPLTAIGSKYILAYKKRHIFNPAAFGVALVGLFFPEYAATWWVGAPILFIPVLISGLLILRKINRFSMVLTFLGVYLASSLLKSPSINFLFANLTQSALIFFATVMLTEPLTSPSRKVYQNFYAALVGILYSIPLFNLFTFVITPEFALITGNIFAFIVNPKYRLDLRLKRKTKLTSDLYELVFNKPKNFDFIPGQYLNWTLPHKKEDSRGNRRYFSLASSPTENSIKIAFRLYEKPSSFKKSLVELKDGEKVIASSLSGDFVLPARLASESVAGRPKDSSQNLAFVAGGIGITPFRSMIKYLVDKKIESNIILLYVVKKKEDLIFMDVFEKASKLGIKTVPLVGKYELEEKDFTDNIPDYRSRTFYISGPQPLVEKFKDTLKNLGVKRIETDYFPGYN